MVFLEAVNFLLMPLIATLALPACTTEVVYETRELAWNECRSWMKEGLSGKGKFFKYAQSMQGFSCLSLAIIFFLHLHQENR